MKKLFIIFVILLAAIWLGLTMLEYAGFVVIHLGHTRIEMTLWTALLTLIVLFLVLYGCIRLYHNIYCAIRGIPTRYQKWSDAKREHTLFKRDQLALRATQLIDQGKHHEAEKLLSKALKTHLDPNLLMQYARLESPKPQKHLARAEVWLARDPENPDLLYCLGRVYQHHRLWGKAQKYLRASIRIKATRHAYQALGDVLEQLNEETAALACYREGLLIP